MKVEVVIIRQKEKELVRAIIPFFFINGYYFHVIELNIFRINHSSTFEAGTSEVVSTVSTCVFPSEVSETGEVVEGEGAVAVAVAGVASPFSLR